jgi:CDP-glycerol glycerophosphotransferase
MKNLLRQIFIRLFRFLPLQNKVVFRNFNGKGLGDDPKYIALELIRNFPDIKLVWLASDINTPHPSQIQIVKFHSLLAYFHLATAKVWVNNIKNSSMYIPKRKGQFYIQTWHAPFGLKKIEADANMNKEYIQRSQLDAAQTDLMYANSDFRLQMYKTKFWYNGPVIKSDSPRISILFQMPGSRIAAIRQELNIPENEGIVLYAPTFREHSPFDFHAFDFQEITKHLEVKFQKHFTLLLRLHPHDASKFKGVSLPSGIVNACDYPDMQELLSISDVLITDFSSSMFDFAMTQKPVFLFAKDFDAYLSSERDLCIPLQDLPFPISKTEADLHQSILNFDEAQYKSKIGDFCAKYGIQDSGQGAKNLATIIHRQITKS